MKRMNSIRHCAALGILLFSTTALPPAWGGDALTVEAFNRQPPQTGIVAVEGYLVNHYRCPPCPQNAICKPCANPVISITLASVNRAPTYRNETQNGVLISRMNHPEKYLLIDMTALPQWSLAPDPPGDAKHSLQLNKKYRVTLEIDTRIERDNLQWRLTTTWKAKDIEPAGPP